jgi:hypothetical protein
MAELTITNTAQRTEIQLLDANNKPYCGAMYVVHADCFVCKCKLGDEIVLALGSPFHCLLHEKCAPHFDYETRRWPHHRPMVAYRQK